MAGDTTPDTFVPSAHSWTDYISTPGWHRYLFFIGKNYVWLCQERRKEPWRNHTGKAKNTLTSATKTVSIFRAIKEQIRRTSIVCSAIVLVVVISALRKAGLKTAPNASFLTEEKISDMLQVNIASLRKLYGSSGKNKKQASSDTGKCIFLCLNWPVLFGGQYLLSVGKDTEDHSLVWRKTLSLGIWLLRISCSGNMAWWTNSAAQVKSPICSGPWLSLERSSGRSYLRQHRRISKQFSLVSPR